MKEGLDLYLDFRDDTLSSTLNKVISGLLPHEYYKPSNFISLYSLLTQTLSKQDTRGLYYIFYTILEKYSILSEVDNYTVQLTSERFSNALENNLYDLILQDNTNIKELMAEEGKSSDISIPSIQEEIVQTLFYKCMNWYDSCFQMKTPTDTAISCIVDLKDTIEHNLIDTSMELLRTIITTGTFLKKVHYAGTQGWVKFANESIKSLIDLSSLRSTRLECDSIKSLDKVEREVEEIFNPLGNYGIEPLDDYTPILQHRLAVIVGKENVGKTKIMIDLVTQLVLEGKKVYIASGETRPSLLWFQILSCYLYKKYDMQLESRYLSRNEVKTLEKSYQQIIATAKMELISSGLIIDDDLTYDTVNSTFIQCYEKGIEAFFIDHSQSLRGRNGRLINELVTQLAMDCRDLKNKYPIYICVLSHPSADLKLLIQKDYSRAFNSQISPTAQSSYLSSEADEIFILFETDLLKKQGLLGWITYKRREAPKINVIFIKTMFHVSAFIYDIKYQAGASDISSDEIEDLLNDSEDEDGLPMDL